MSSSHYFDRLNLINDSRSCDRAAAPVLYLGEREIALPTRWEVCPVCHGAGSHVDPAVDAGGLSEELAADGDFMADYLGGAYDIPCNRCGGRSTVQAVDWDRLTPEQAKAYERQLRDEDAERAAHMAEIRAGA